MTQQLVTINCFHPVVSVNYMIPEHVIRCMSGVLHQQINYRDAKRLKTPDYLQTRGKIYKVAQKRMHEC